MDRCRGDGERREDVGECEKAAATRAVRLALRELVAPPPPGDLVDQGSARALGAVLVGSAGMTTRSRKGADGRGGPPASSARTPRPSCCAAAAPSACSTTAPPASARTWRRPAARRSSLRVASAATRAPTPPRRASTARSRRDPLGGPALGAAFDPGSADDQRGQRRRHAERGAGGTRRRDAEGGLRLVLIRVRPRTGIAQDREAFCRSRSRPTASRSSRRSSTA